MKTIIPDALNKPVRNDGKSTTDKIQCLEVESSQEKKNSIFNCCLNFCNILKKKKSKSLLESY